MILYHWTPSGNVEQILKEGIKRDKSKPIYLTKFPDKWKNLYSNATLLKVDVTGKTLTTFEQYRDGTEVLCWNDIEPERLASAQVQEFVHNNKKLLDELAKH